MKQKQVSKVLLFLTASILLLASLTGCNSKKSESDDNKAVVTETPAVTEEPTETEEPAETEAVSKKEYVEIDQLAKVKSGETVASMTIKDYGTIKMKFFPEAAPKAVENFITHAKEGYYDGVTFHRVISDFMIQGGDPEGTGRGGESIWGESFEDEISPYLLPLRGALCMANASGGNTNGSQFFIVQNSEILDTEGIAEIFNYYIPYYKSETGLELDAFADLALENYQKVGGCLYLAGGYTVFGQVFEGMEIVDEISKVGTENDRPLKDVVIEKIEITEY
ncbi:peptidylprolyl isomerase [Anaeromicropila populeti]|uniref:Peptidyl-prolyl cis-trans isomerase n=1 Tax=Anaeromicropila populeti TaxID=37658 RepID=A0A1I6J7S2_9FIRM|nr:peptidylprolyl isomerase [Anaeromicropila populeti]SFR75028.1 peptidyl-prolyl cis-trans isomerase B (cyclophilin B) [Anaeromicropila populeti]